MLDLNKVKEKYSNHPILTNHIDLLTQTKGSETTSGKYRPITTLDVLDTFVSAGFEPVKINKTNARREINKGFEKHEIILNPPSSVNLKIDGVTPRLHLKNSYDAGHALQFYLGVYRVLCSNGLVIGKGIFHERVIHLGDVETKVKEALYRSTNAFDLASKNINEWTKFQLSRSQQDDLALRLLNIRLPKSTDEIKYYFRSRDIDLATKVVRLGDTSNDLFTVFNRIQEKLIQRPSISYIKEENLHKQVRKLRNLNGFQASLLNSKLWDEANNFYKEVA